MKLKSSPEKTTNAVYLISVPTTPPTIYIGETNNIERRFEEHLTGMYTGTHHNKVLQEAYENAGTFTFKVLGWNLTSKRAKQLEVRYIREANKRSGVVVANVLRVLVAKAKTQFMKNDAETVVFDGVYTTAKQIAKVYNVSLTTAYRWIKREKEGRD